MSFQPAFNARLIAEVKKHPCLYNHSKRGSGDTMERMRIWEMIAAAVDSNCSGDFAKKRWLQLRDRYRKELKTAIKHNFVTPIRWCYFSHLSWLDPYLKDNLVLSACDGYGDNSDGYSNCVDGLSLNNVKAELDDDPSDDQSSTAAGADEDLKADTGRGDDAAASKELNDRKLDRNEATMQAGKSVLDWMNDEDFLYCRIIGVRLKKMDPRKRRRAGKSVLDWMNDEDFLYCRIIGVRLKKMDPRKRRRVRAQIMSLLEESEGEMEDDDDSMSSPNVDGAESSAYDQSLVDPSG
ncbi:hypothetical protein TELCIR_10199 [Teladorsagia circumcincta]|uniref:MADF domain-containing protein n=1 Tax=Teladorsagia circumcincta TaxID=45464 RepID=A0A2G9UE68_TELCI|nr:hypothetical protein TELCIR_10199 [Teladorsagia circumcincta]